jgi:deoxycytidine triphosphate deaminase
MILSEWLASHPEVTVSPVGCVLTDTDWRVLHDNGLLVERKSEGKPREIVVQEASLDVHLALATKLTDTSEAEIVVKEGHDVVICPGEVMIIQTQERFKVPDDVRGLVAPKGKVTNLGLTIPTTYVDPGFTKPLFLAVANAGPRAVRLESGSAIAKVELQRLGGSVAEPWDGQTPAWALFHKALFAEVDCEVPGYIRSAMEQLRTEVATAAAPAPVPIPAPVQIAALDGGLAREVRMLQLWVFALTITLLAGAVAVAAQRAFDSNFGQAILAGVVAAGVFSLIAWVVRGAFSTLLEKRSKDRH